MPSGHRRVCFLIDSLQHGGAERMLVAVAPALVKRGWQVRVDVVTDRFEADWRDQLMAAGVEFRSHGLTRTLDLAGWRRIDRSLAGWRATVVHTQLEAADVIGGFLRRRFGPVVSTQHVFDEPSTRRAATRDRLHRFVLRRRMLSVIAVSAAGRTHLVEGVGVPAATVELIHNGVEVAEGSAIDRAAVRTAFGIAPDEMMIVCCAVLRRAKGIDFALRALAQPGAPLERARLVVIGEGDHRGALEQIVQEQRLAGRVTFAGHRDDAVRLIGAADVFAHPTLLDMFPTAVIEAMACGLPVVASRTGGVPEIVDDGVTGVLVEPGNVESLADALTNYLRDPALRLAHGRAGRQRYLEEFTLAKQLDELEALYRRVGRST